MNRKTLTRQFCSLLACLTLSSSLAFAQTGYKEKENVEYLSIEDIQETLQSSKISRTTLPTRVDHSASKYMSEVVNQGSMGSCGSASRICYMFAYEINNYRDVSGKIDENRYPSHFTWMLTDQNSGKENMAIFNGIPNILTYGGRQYNATYGGNVSWPDKYPQYGWMNGFDKWRSAMDNRLEKTVNIKLNTDEAIEYLKNWIYDHCGDTDFKEGGVAGGGAASSGWTTKTIPTGKHEAGKLIVTAYGSTIDHGTVWSGYDDEIEYDLNNDGTITDDEKGALILLNSWGETWGNSGCVYVPYKIVKEYGGGLSAELYYVRKNFTPVDVFRIKMDYNQRCNIKISIGVSDDPNASEPNKVTAAEHFKYAGFEPIPLLGQYNGVINNEPMEFGLDLTDLTSIGYDTRNAFRYFLVIETQAASTGVGTVSELEVLRYTEVDGEQTSEVVGTISSPVSISGGGSKIIIPIDVTGNESVEPAHLYVPQNRLSVKAQSTQETTGEGENNGKAIYSIDGDESTYWHSGWKSGTPAYPHTITFEIDSAFMLNGFEYLPRQNHANGRIGDYELYIMDNLGEQGTLVSSGTFENNASLKRAFFEPITGKYIRLYNYKAANGDNNTCMAEFNLFYKPSDKTPEEPNAIELVEQEGLIVKQEESVLQISGIEGVAVFTLYNTQGQVVLNKQTNTVAGAITGLNIAKLAKGVYVLQVNESNRTRSAKILIE